MLKRGKIWRFCLFYGEKAAPSEDSILFRTTSPFWKSDQGLHVLKKREKMLEFRSSSVALSRNVTLSRDEQNRDSQNVGGGE